jgi:hypothetical protein
MTEPNLKELVNRLQDALEDMEDIDEDTIGLVRELDAEIHRLTEAGANPDEYETVLDQAQSIETRFAVEHPVAERFLREIIDALAKVGI